MFINERFYNIIGNVENRCILAVYIIAVMLESWDGCPVIFGKYILKLRL